MPASPPAGPQKARWPARSPAHPSIPSIDPPCLPLGPSSVRPSVRPLARPPVRLFLRQRTTQQVSWPPSYSNFCLKGGSENRVSVFARREHGGLGQAQDSGLQDCRTTGLQDCRTAGLSAQGSRAQD